MKVLRPDSPKQNTQNLVAFLCRLTCTSRDHDLHHTLAFISVCSEPARQNSKVDLSSLHDAGQLIQTILRFLRHQSIADFTIPLRNDGLTPQAISNRPLFIFDPVL